jgi:hypothetical protein
MITALSVPEAEHIRDMGDAARCPYSDVLAGLIRIGFNHLDELPPELQPKPTEEELQLTEPQLAEPKPEEDGGEDGEGALQVAELQPKPEEEEEELQLAESA